MAKTGRRCKCGEELLTKSNRCVPCSVEANRRLARLKLEKGLSKYTVYNYKAREKNPKGYMLSNAKQRAKKKGLEFNLTVDDFDIPEVCPVFGMKLVLEAGVGTKDNRPSLDRIDSTKGYIKGNVQVISWRANNLKSDGTAEEFLKLSEFLNANRGS